MQKKPKRRNIMHGEFVLLPEHMEKGGGISCTVPDESMTIREIMRKHVSGMCIKEQLSRQGYYEDGDHDSPDLEKLAKADLFDRAQALEDNRNKIKHLEQKAKADQAKALEAAKESGKKPETAKATTTTKEEAKTESGEGDTPDS